MILLTLQLCMTLTGIIAHAVQTAVSCVGKLCVTADLRQQLWKGECVAVQVQGRRTPWRGPRGIGG